MNNNRIINPNNNIVRDYKSRTTEKMHREKKKEKNIVEQIKDRLCII
ncbi:MAG: hypothetical protein SO179_02225 [Bacteroidales bacterium]|nr:hypothetical protein [Bacteroidales bacterium]